MIPRPTWLARETGLAHAFLPSARNGDGLHLRAWCGTVDRSIGQPFSAAPPERAHCSSCHKRAREAAKMAVIGKGRA